MSQIKLKNQACYLATCGSSDAMQIYEDNTAYCFSCKTYFKADKTAVETEEIKIELKAFPNINVIDSIKALKSRGFRERQIEKHVCEFFDVKVKCDTDGIITDHYYPYSNGGYKHRKLPKIFSWIGTPGGLFGLNKFSTGGKRLVITEGEIDALAVSQANWEKYKQFYPVISISSATETKSLLEHREWIRGFDEVVLCLDNDKAGEDATQRALKIVGIDKAKIWKPSLKDASEVLTQLGPEKLLYLIWDAIPWQPAGIIGKEQLWKELSELNKVIPVPYPACLEGLNGKLKGMREGEITLFISGTGCFGRGTEVLMANGDKELIENIKVNDCIMGDDGTPRTVLSLFSGREQMAHIKLQDGTGFICNCSHIISIIINNKIIDIKLKDYDLLPYEQKCKSKAFKYSKSDLYTQYSFEIEWLEEDNFYGFSTDGNNRFVLGNFIVTHNSGKSSIIREIELHVLLVTKDKIGVVSLEESPAEHARKLAGMTILRNPSNEEIPIDDLKIGFDKVFNDDRVILLDHQGSIKDSSIIDQLEYMCLVGCRYIFVDHITILVSEGAEELSGNTAIDKIMNDLLRLVKRYPVWIGLVSHLRKSPSGGKSFEEGRLPSVDDIKGSGSIKQISFDIVAFARNMLAEEGLERNTIKMSVLKARTSGLTGPVQGVWYDYATGRLLAIEAIPVKDTFGIQ